MSRINEFIQRINDMQCPNGEMEEKIASIAEEYRLANKDEVSVYRENNYDTVYGDGYRVDIQNNNPISLKLVTSTGAEDYVIRVVETQEI